ncbi:hypothetical protein AGMMS49545_11670 [Betaproteobacteria bacterium]|nr:hypothetical protein AGMMS49545_11670 [Betaproteobacteria bacterium]GHU45927.1 hypothetical protein AGMMS50289_18140 [Betaproteobacteria bacterium]
MIELLLSLAIVTQDQIPLRAAPNETAARHATLSQGDHLEVRGVKGDYLQVYDHRRERAGFIRATQAGRYPLTPESAPRLKAVVDYLKDQPGSEAVGIAHTAAFLKAAPAESIDADVFEALGKMVDRLAWRASRLGGTANEKAAKIVAEHLEVAATYGVTVYSVERNDKMTLCYEGDAWRRVLSLSASLEQKVRAALSLTRHDCVKSTLLPTERLETDFWRAEILDGVLTAAAKEGNLPEHLKNRLKIRAAGVWASLAHQLARRPKSDPAAVLKAGQRAETELAGVDKKTLVDGDLLAWNEAAIRVGASRWAAEPQTVAVPTQGRPGIQMSAGEAGQTCVQIVEGAKHPAAKPIQSKFSQCTYGQVWSSSLTVSPDGKAMTLAVQPLENWREMWVFRREESGWQVDIIPPSVDNPELGYVEFAGWVPGNKQLLAARETVTDGRSKTSFELWDRNTLKVEKHADKPGNLTAFYRWQDPLWKGGTVAVR